VIAAYPWPAETGDGAEEFTLAFDQRRAYRLLVVPALFDESNRLRRLTVEVMRRLDAAGIDAFLIDLPGCNESLASPGEQTVEGWRAAVAAAAEHFGVSHLLGIRGGALLLPADLPGWRYAPVNGANLLRQMLRARIVASREAGVAESQEGLIAQGQSDGLDLAGHRLGPEMLRQLQSARPAPVPGHADISQDMVGGGGGLWLRAEPGDDRAQADALAAILAVGMKSGGPKA
jgi:hypothetical protein